jgi:CDP-diacylglycerol--glycerol-3-phosphate 3-phosphatidyltransferase
MTLPNKLSFLRLFLTPFAVIFLFLNIPYNYHIAIIIFAVAAFSDILDGYIARKYKKVTSFGKFFDPLVDKILNQSMLITLLSLNIFPLWIVLLVFVRDIAVDAFSSLAVSHKKFVSAVMPGKIKSFLITLAIIIGEMALAAKAGYNIFQMDFESLRNAAYILLIFSLLLGFMGSTQLLKEVISEIKGKFKMEI